MVKNDKHEVMEIAQILKKKAVTWSGNSWQIPE